MACKDVYVVGFLSLPDNQHALIDSNGCKVEERREDSLHDRYNQTAMDDKL